MCGRYNLTDSPLVQTLMADLGIDLNSAPLDQLLPLYNIAPTEHVPVIVKQNGNNRCVTMRWWLVPRWSHGPTTQYAMFNARRETIRESRAYAVPLERQRAIVPASSFVEWQRDGKSKMPVQLETESIPLAFAAVWDCWGSAEDKLLSCSIITRAASGAFSRVHNRMPVLLKPADYETWIDPDTPASEIDRILDNEMVPEITATPLSHAVNDARNKSGKCLSPVGISPRINLCCRRGAYQFKQYVYQATPVLLSKLEVENM